MFRGTSGCSRRSCWTGRAPPRRRRSAERPSCPAAGPRTPAGCRRGSSGGRSPGPAGGRGRAWSGPRTGCSGCRGCPKGCPPGAEAEAPWAAWARRRRRGTGSDRGPGWWRPAADGSPVGDPAVGDPAVGCSGPASPDRAAWAWGTQPVIAGPSGGSSAVRRGAAWPGVQGSRCAAPRRDGSAGCPATASWAWCSAVPHAASSCRWVWWSAVCPWGCLLPVPVSVRGRPSVVAWLPGAASRVSRTTGPSAAGCPPQRAAYRWPGAPPWRRCP